MRRRQQAFKSKRKLPLKFKGVEFKSGLELRIAQNLTKKGVRWKYEKTHFPWIPPPPRKRRYGVDFDIISKSGKCIHIEAKGYFDVDARRKMACVRAGNPEADIRLLFEHADKKCGKKMRYRDWADKYGYKWAEGDEVPDEWLNE